MRIIIFASLRPKIKKYTQLLGQKIYNKSTEVLNLLCYTNNIEVHSCYYDCLIGCDMKKKKKAKNKKDLKFEIFCFCLALICILSAISNYRKLFNLEKNGIIENVIVKSYSIKSSYSRYGSNYRVKIEYSLIGENLIQKCTLYFKPDEEYFENKKIQILRDPKTDFKLPINEKEAFKRSEISQNIVNLILLLVTVLISSGLDYIFEKNRNKNKKIKKLVKKNPELKEKYKKRENVKARILLILLLPFLLIGYFVDKIKNRKKGNNKNNM